MEMTPCRQALIDARLAESRASMIDAAFELNDLVRFAIAASKDKGHRVYYPMDPVNESVRNWAGLSKKLAELTRRIEQTSSRLSVLPFEPERPAADDLPTGLAP